MQRYSKVFAHPSKKAPPTTSEVVHHIDTGDHAPINKPQFRLSPKEQEILIAETKAMLDAGIIEPCTSQWKSPMFVIPKKTAPAAEKKYRVIMDVRALNDITRTTSYPMTTIDDMLDGRAGCTVLSFSVLDAKAGYWQIPINEADRDKVYADLVIAAKLPKWRKI